MTRSLVLGVLFAFPGLVYGSLATGTAACPTATLATYETSYVNGSLGTFAGTGNGSNSCAIGILLFSDFNFPTPTGTGGATLDSASHIQVTPSNNAFTFSQVNGLPFTVLANQTATYLIEYGFFIDPAPVVGSADLSLDPPVGNVSVTQSYCNDSQLSNPGTPNFACYNPNTLTTSAAQSLMVVNPTKLTDSIVFSSPATQYAEVLTTITLAGGSSGASFDSITSDTTVSNAVPEPSYYLLVSAGLLLLGCGRYRLRR